MAAVFAERTGCPVPVWRPQNTNIKTGKRLISAIYVLVSFYLLRLFTQQGFHSPDLGALPAVDIGCEIKHLGILTGPAGIEQFFYHDQSTIMVLDHSGQEQPVKLRALCLF